MTLIPPSRVFSFETFDNQNPVQKPPGDRLDAQFAAHADAIRSIQDFLANLLRSDGKLANDIVHLHALSPTLREAIAAEVAAKVDPMVSRAVSAAATAESASAFAEQALSTVTSRVTQAVDAANRVEGAAGSTLARSINARQSAELSLQTLQDAQLDLFNSQETIKAGAGESEEWARASMAWAEHMPDILPADTIAWMGITGDHWSSRWWANKCNEIAQGVEDDADNVDEIWDQFQSLYLGAFQLPPTLDNQGNPIVVGAMYFDTDDNTMYVWTGIAWQAMTGDVGVASITNVGTGSGVYLQTIASNVQLRTLKGTGKLSITEGADVLDFAIAPYDWSDIGNKPTTFPPTLPIPSSGVTGLDSAQSSQDALISGLQTNKVAKAGDTMTGPLLLPAPAPTLPAHATNKSYVDAQDAALAASIGSTVNGKVSKSGDTMTGNLAIQGATPALTFNTTPATLANGYLAFQKTGSMRWAFGPVTAETGSGNAGTDMQLARYDDSGAVINPPAFVIKRSNGVFDFKATPTVNGSPLIGGATISDTPPAGASPGQFWWESDQGGLYLYYSDPNSSQWVMVNAPSLGDAPATGGPFARQANAWLDLTATLNAKANASDYLPLTGGALTGNVSTSGGFYQDTAAVGAAYFRTSTAQNGSYGVYGATGGSSYYGYLALWSSGTFYSLYGNGSLYLSGSGTFGSAIVLGGPLSFTNVANMVLGYGNDSIWTIPSSNHFQFAFSGTTRYRIETSIFRCLVDSTASLGAGSYKWSTVYAATGTINTSDEREKQDIRPLNEAELRVSQALKPLITTYRWKSSVTEKGVDDARIHVGVIAQRVKEAFEAEGLDAHQYGLFCADPVMVWHDAVREEDPDTREVRTVTEGWEEDTGEIRYGVRYDELIMFILGGL